MKNRAGALLAACLLTAAATIGFASDANTAGAATTNCGPNICTIYLTRTETRAVANYLNSVNGGALQIAGVACSTIFYKFPVLGAFAGPACQVALSRYDWRSAAKSAAAHNACFQVAYPNKWYGKAFPTPGETNWPGYCQN
jgi:hypothetical protein